MRRVAVLMTVIAMVFVVAAPAYAGSGERQAGARLSGANEVPPVESEGQGEVRLTLYRDHIDFKLIVTGLDDVTQAHIHIGGPDENGPVVAFLFGFVEGGIAADGLIARGTITEADLIGPMAGQPLTALIDAIKSGGAYVNVHTVTHPAGEIRGQLG